MKKLYRQDIKRWYIERTVFLIAGILVVISAGLAIAGYFSAIYFSIFTGGMLMIFAVTGYCPMAIILNKIGLREK